jgi:hypothetical protein
VSTVMGGHALSAAFFQLYDEPHVSLEAWIIWRCVRWVGHVAVSVAGPVMLVVVVLLFSVIAGAG